MGTLTKKDGGENETRVVTHKNMDFCLTGNPIPKDKRRYVREAVVRKKTLTKATTNSPGKK